MASTHRIVSHLYGHVPPELVAAVVSDHARCVRGAIDHAEYVARVRYTMRNHAEALTCAVATAQLESVHATSMSGFLEAVRPYVPDAVWRAWATAGGSAAVSYDTLYRMMRAKPRMARLLVEAAARYVYDVQERWDAAASLAVLREGAYEGV